MFSLRKIFASKVGLVIALIGIVGGAIWSFQSDWQVEPIILLAASTIEIIGYFLTPKDDLITGREGQKLDISIKLTQQESASDMQQQSPRVKIDRTAIIESMKSKTKILFIDDDKKFNVVKLLKDSGWNNTKTVSDIKNLDVPAVKEADVIFVDINGVGKLLGLESQGLDLVLMLKQKYPEKKLIIYSANRNSNSFHSAWDKCDYKLEKNALPYQFQNIVEQCSFDKYNSQI